MKYLHAKIASDIVDLAHQSKHEVYLHRGRITVDAKSILGIMSLGYFDGVSVETEDVEIAKAIRGLFE